MNVFTNVQLTSLTNLKRPIPERGAKGLVRETPENLKIEHRMDLDWSPGRIRLAANQISCSPKIALEGIHPIVKAIRTVPSPNKLF